MEITELLQKENSIFLVKTEDLQKLADFLADRQPSQPQPAKQEIEKPIPQTEAFEFLGKSRQTFYKWRRKGIIKGHTLGGRIYFFKSELIEALNAKRA
jgi:predicted DNA-binding transcriptional regulator AlpA